MTSKGILPNNVLYINSNSNGYAIWHTPTMITDLYFNDFLPIPDGKAYIPPMIWKASKNQLQVFAVLNVKRPSLETPLFNAPFFNIGKSGAVCMGNVSIDISPSTNLEDFIVKWMRYFFDSKFTHLLIDNPANQNIVQLWQGIINTEKPFPMKALKKTKYTLQNLL